MYNTKVTLLFLTTLVLTNVVLGLPNYDDADSTPTHRLAQRRWRHRTKGSMPTPTTTSTTDYVDNSNNSDNSENSDNSDNSDTSDNNDSSDTTTTGAASPENTKTPTASTESDIPPTPVVITHSASVPTAVSTPSTPSTPSTLNNSGSYWRPSASQHIVWNIELSTVPFVSSVQAAVSTYGLSVIDVDLFDTDPSTISAYKTAGVKVICYFSAGSYENWRADASSFPSSMLLDPLDGWPGENWLQLSGFDTNPPTSALAPIMQKRFEMAKQKGCDAVDVCVILSIVFIKYKQKS